MANTQLAIRRELVPSTWEMIKAVAPAMHQARFFGVASPEQAMAIMIKGHELGLGLSAAFEFIKVVQGRPTLSPMGALALIQASPLCAGVRIEDLKAKDGKPSACRVWMKRSNGFEYTCEFSIEDARQAGLVKADSGWEKYPTNMLRWRAVGFCADVVFPDVIGGMKRADEFGADLTQSGDVIDGSWTAAPPPAQIESPAMTLDGLLAMYDAEAVLVANEGRIPATDEEVAAVAQKLAENA